MIIEYITLIDRLIIQLLKTIIGSDNLLDMFMTFTPVAIAIMLFIYDSHFLMSIKNPEEEINRLENQVKELANPIESMEMMSHNEYRDLIDDLQKRSGTQNAILQNNDEHEHQTVADVWDSLNDEQKNVIFKIIGEQLNEERNQSSYWM